MSETRGLLNACRHPENTTPRIESLSGPEYVTGNGPVDTADVVALRAENERLRAERDHYRERVRGKLLSCGCTICTAEANGEISPAYKSHGRKSAA